MSHTFEELTDEEALVHVISAREATQYERAKAKGVPVGDLVNPVCATRCALLVYLVE